MVWSILPAGSCARQLIPVQVPVKVNFHLSQAPVAIKFYTSKTLYSWAPEIHGETTPFTLLECTLYKFGILKEFVIKLIVYNKCCIQTKLYKVNQKISQILFASSR